MKLSNSSIVHTQPIFHSLCHFSHIVQTFIIMYILKFKVWISSYEKLFQMNKDFPFIKDIKYMNGCDKILPFLLVDIYIFYNLF